MSEYKREVRQNVLALGADFVLFMLGFTFFDPFVVVPAFVKQFTGSDLMVGVLAALRVLTISLPQLWAASVLVARPRKRPLLIASSIGGRLPIAVLAVATGMPTVRSHHSRSRVACFRGAAAVAGRCLSGNGPRPEMVPLSRAEACCRAGPESTIY